MEYLRIKFDGSDLDDALELWLKEKIGTEVSINYSELSPEGKKVKNPHVLNVHDNDFVFFVEYEKGE